MKTFLILSAFVFTLGAQANSSKEVARKLLQEALQCPVVNSSLVWVVVDHKCVDEKYTQSIEALEADELALANEIESIYYKVSETIVSISEPPQDGVDESYTGYVLRFKLPAAVTFSPSQRKHNLSRYTADALKLLK